VKRRKKGGRKGKKKEEKKGERGDRRGHNRKGREEEGEPPRPHRLAIDSLDRKGQ